MTSLNKKSCQPCEGGVTALSKENALALLQQIPNWQLSDDAHYISRRFNFKNFFRSMSFVNAVAYVANNENHHPDMKIGYNYCEIIFTTHAISGLSENDFICAAKIDQLITQ